MTKYACQKIYTMSVAVPACYAALQLTPDKNGLQLLLTSCIDAEKLNSEMVIEAMPVATKNIWQRVVVDEGALCQFSYSENG